MISSVLLSYTSLFISLDFSEFEEHLKLFCAILHTVVCLNNVFCFFLWKADF